MNKTNYILGWDSPSSTITVLSSTFIVFHWKSDNQKLRNSSTSVWWISSLPVALKPVKTSYSNITFFSDWVDCGHWHRRNHHHQAERLWHWHGKFFIKLKHRLSAFLNSIFVILNVIFSATFGILNATFFNFKPN